ncbi:hypothetical protein EDD86DRAFT_246544 [Gorgonomyces haynaldii]|nr:hypothetical protein EDD86DRAFT_246544 [Gorgonomyces haynaldii]
MTSDLSVFGSCPLDLQKQIKDHLDAHPDSLDLLVKLLNQPPPKIIERKLPKPSTPVIAQMSVTMQLPLRKKVNVEFYQDLVHFEADQTVQYQYQDLQHLLVFNTPNKMGHYTCVGITDKPEFIFGFEKLDVKTRLKLDTHPKKAMELLVQKIIKRPLSFIPRDGIQVECHQRTKDGVLVITKELIFFGLKKPLFYWKTSEVDHVHINSITQRTFNLTVEKKDEMVEFSLIDASEYDKMRKYIEELVNIGEEGPKPVPEEDEEEDHDFQDSGRI